MSSPYGPDPANPFQSPMSDAASYSSGVAPSVRTAEILRQTRPWVLFLAILATVFTVLGLLGMLVQIAVLMSMGGGRAEAVGVGIGFLVVGALMSLLYIMPIVFLYRYSGRIKHFLQVGGVDALDHALDAQKSFWKFVGIVVAIITGLYLLFIAGAIAVASIAAFS